MIRPLAVYELLRARVAQFRASERGNIAMIFALAVIPIIGATGAAVDYSRASNARTALQAALDSAGLILSKEAQTLNATQLQNRADAVVKANLNQSNVTNLIITPTFTTPQSGSFSLVLTATGKLDTTFAGIWQPTMDIGAKSEILWGMKRLELVLALDNTGSMSSSKKMTELKKAAKDLLTTLQNAAKKAEDIKIAIVPFATDVNVGPTNVNATWIRWTEWESDNANYTCMKSGKEVTDSRGRRITDKDDCKDRDKDAKWQLNARSTWNGCVWDRDQSYDVNNTATSGNATYYSAHQASACPVPMMTLTNNWANLNSKIDSMQPVGNTNVTIGLQMAFQMLSPVAPFNASAPKADLDKVIVLLTDGDNTQNRWSTSQTSIDARTRLACTNAKADNIKLYVIRVINGNATLLQQCATKTEMYYDVQNASQLSAVFSTIAQNLANLRIAK